MPLRISCPSCQSSLSMPESMYGKAVRCPKCKSPFQCPSGPSPTAPAPRAARAPARPAAGGDPFNFAEAPAAAPAATPYYDDDGEEVRPRKRSHGWDRVKGGFVFLHISAACYLAFFAIAFFFFLDMSDGKQPPAESTVKIIAILLGLLVSAAPVLGGVGLARCSGVPAESRAKGTASVATAFMVLAAVVFAFVTAVLLIAILSEEPPGEWAADSLPVIMAVGGASLAGTFVLTLFFLFTCGMHLHRSGLMASVMAYFVVMAASPFWLFIAGFVRGLLEGPRGLRMSKKDEDFTTYLPLIIVAAATVWFMLMLVALSAGINQARGRGRA